MIERRICTRLSEPFPVNISGTNQAGEGFEIDTIVDNLSARGLYVRLIQPLKPSTRLSLILRMSRNGEASAPRIAANGMVVRVEPQPDGRFGLAIALTKHRFL